MRPRRMHPTRGKLAAIAAFVVCAAVIAAATPIAWKFVLESWRLRQLDSGGAAERRAAVVALGEMRSGRAAPRLLELVRMDDALGPLAVLALVRIEKAAPPELLDALRPKDVSFRRRTAAALSDFAADHPAAVPVLLELALRGPKEEGNERVLWQAVEGLKQHGPDGVRFLIEALHDPDLETRSRAVRILGSFGASATAAVPEIQALLGCAEQSLGSEASAALATIGPAAVPALVEALASEHEGVRAEATSGLARMGPPAVGAVPTLVKALRDSKYRVRRGAVSALGSIGPGAGDAISVLIAALKDSAFGEREWPEGEPRIYFSDPECDDARVSLPHALVKIGPQSAEVLAALVLALEDKNACIRTAAAQALGEMGPTAAAAAQALAQALDAWLREDMGPIGPWRHRSDPREAAATALGKIGVDSDLVMRVFTIALASEDRDLSRAARDAIAKLGARAAGAIPVLVEAMGASTYGGDCPEEADTLAKIGPAALPALLQALSSDHRGVRKGAACALGDMGPQAREAVPALLALLDDEDGGVRWAAAHGLYQISPGDEAVIHRLSRALGDKEPRVRVTAVYALRVAGPKALAAVPALRAILKAQGDSARPAVPPAIAAITGGTRETVDLLLEVLKEEDTRVRQSAVSGLRHVGAGGAAVMDALMAALMESGPAGNHEEYWRVRESAAEALLRMGSKGLEAVLLALRSDNKAIRRFAARALGSLRPLPDAAIKALEALLVDELDEGVAQEARIALNGLRRK